MKNEFFKLSVMLCLITLVAALLLSGVNAITKERIAAASDKASQNAMQSILTDADNFKSITDSIFEGAKNGNTVGYCVKIFTKGFGGEIEMMIGFDADKTVRGIEILNHSETPGLGAKAASSEFKEQFKGKSSDLSVVKTPTDSPYEISAITGATITSRAVAKGIKDAAELLVQELGGENK